MSFLSWYGDNRSLHSFPTRRSSDLILAAYTSVMEAVAGENGVLFVDAFRASQTWYRESKEPLTADGALLNERSEEHTSELQSRLHLVCRLLLEKKKNLADAGECV